MWVLDGRDNALFGYDLASGTLLAEYALDSDNDDPHGIWSDGVTVWVSDHNDKRLFAYRLPAPEDDTAEDEDLALERVRAEEFSKLPRASNNSPRGIWSDEDVMYVADESDGRVYTYNMPDDIDARLASLSLSGVDFGEFSGRQPEYEGIVNEDATATTVEAQAVQSGAEVAIDPPDAADANGHQVELEGVEEITVTVTSADARRTKVYRVYIAGAVDAGEARPVRRPIRAIPRRILPHERGLLLAQGGPGHTPGNGLTVRTSRSAAVRRTRARPRSRPRRHP